MTVTSHENEAEIMQMMEPSIRSYCKWRWTSIEMEDRVSEARYVFLIVLRDRRLPAERVWHVFQRTLDQYMPPINRLEAQHRYGCRSLDAKIRTHDGAEGSALIDLIPSPQPEPCEIVVNLLEQEEEKTGCIMGC